jgi:SsrA-binding protein
MAKKKSNTSVIDNNKARFNYEIIETLQAGLVLTGRETKAIRIGRADLTGAYVNLVNGEWWLIGASIYGTPAIPINDTEQKRNRKLLLKTREVEKLIEKKHNGLTVVPLKLHKTTRYIKLDIALAKGKKKYDKRETIKRRETDRNIARKLSR